MLYRPWQQNMFCQWRGELGVTIYCKLIILGHFSLYGMARSNLDIAVNASQPKPYRWHENSKDVGGWNPAMDYAPIRIGVWNCADSKFSTTSTFTEGDMGSFDASDVFGSMESAIGTYGGQTLCPSCRCLQSSLREASYGFDPSFTRKGLCYRINCATPTKLQVGIKGYYDEAWYNCPTEGGALYISGFTGSLMCPKASEFCKREVVTYEFNAVQDSTAEWIISSLIACLSTSIVICWRLNAKLRQLVLKSLRRMHGTGDLYAMWEIALRDASRHEFQKHPLRQHGRNIVRVASMILALLAFYFFIVGIWALRASILLFALGMFFIAYKGMCAFLEPHPGPNLMLYAYAQVALGIPSFIISIAAFAIPDIIATYVGGVNIPLLPALLLDKLVFSGIVLLLLFAACTIGYVGAVCILGMTIASHSNLVLGNMILLIVGICGIGFASGWAGAFGVGNAVVGFMPGLLVTANSIVGIYGLLKKRKRLLIGYAWGVGISCAFNAIIGFLKLFSLAFAEQSAVLNDWSQEQVDTTSIYIFNTKEFCPGKYKCRNSLAYTLFNRICLSGLFDLTCTILYLIPISGLLYIVKERASLANQFQHYMNQHPSKINFKNYEVAVELRRTNGEDSFGFLRSESVRKSDHEAAKELQRIFRGYSLRRALKGAAMAVVSADKQKRQRVSQTKSFLFKDVTLGLEFDFYGAESGGVVVKCMGIHENTSAFSMDIKCFDVLTAVDGLSIVGMREDQVRNILLNLERPVTLTFCGERDFEAGETLNLIEETKDVVNAAEVNIEVDEDVQIDPVEDEIFQMLEIAATEIQRHVRGWITRKNL